MGYIFQPEILHGAARRAVATGSSLHDEVASIRGELLKGKT